MTQEKQPVNSVLEIPLPPNLSIPEYHDTSEPDSRENSFEKPSNTFCAVHGTLQSPYLTAHLQQPTTQVHLQKLSAAFADASNEECCSACAMRSAVRELTGYARELKGKKRGGEWSRQEKKGLKRELKVLMKEVKRGGF